MVYPEHRRRSGFQEARVILLEFFLFRHLDEIALGYVMKMLDGDRKSVV